MSAYTAVTLLGSGLSGLEIQQRFATPWIQRCRDVVVHDEPVPVDPSKAVRCADPESTARRPVPQRSAQAVETMRERHVAANGDRDVANLNADRRLKYCEGRFPV